jgi:glycosyltransferase involved in cell wall biosynthesis
MVPLEINAAGRPVIAYKGGGALDTVVDGVSGVYFEEPTCESLSEAIEAFESRSWNPSEIRRHAQRFDIRAFHDKFFDLLQTLRPKNFTAPLLRSDSAVA